MSDNVPASVVLEVSDFRQMAALQQLLELDGRASVSRRARLPEPGRQGTGDLLTVAAAGGGLAAALRVLPEFIRSRRSRVSVTVTVGEKQVVFEGDNLSDAAALLEKLLGD